jgi:hypothetical protein
MGGLHGRFETILSLITCLVSQPKPTPKKESRRCFVFIQISRVLGEKKKNRPLFYPSLSDYRLFLFLKRDLTVNASGPRKEWLGCK